MRRKKDDKRVLIPRSNPKHPQNNRNKRNKRIRRNNEGRINRGTRQKSKKSGISLLLVIIALVAFVIGAGIGVSLCFDNGADENNNASHVVNVTKEMTTNLNDTEPIYYDQNEDGIDFNDNQTLAKFNITDNTTPSY